MAAAAAAVAEVEERDDEDDNAYSDDGATEEVRQRDFRRDLEDRERLALRERQKERARKEGKALVSWQRFIDNLMKHLIS